MPSGVVFLVCIPSSNYEHILKFGKPKDMLSLKSLQEPSKSYKLEVELRGKRGKSIPVHLTQEYYNDAFSPTLDNIKEDEDLITQENVSTYKIIDTFLSDNCFRVL